MPIQINKIPIKHFSERRSKLEALSVQSSLARSWNWIRPPCASSPLNSPWWQKYPENIFDIFIVQPSIAGEGTR